MSEQVDLLDAQLGRGQRATDCRRLAHLRRFWDRYHRGFRFGDQWFFVLSRAVADDASVAFVAADARRLGSRWIFVASLYRRETIGL